ncbi:MAG: alkaline phosphatase family protein [Elusimicrobiota bacterium]
MVGLDGLDWDVLRPMLADGRMPNLARLAASGSTGTMIVPPPLRSPAIWTSAATGASPDAHGVKDFFIGTRRTASSDRRVEAIWESASFSSKTVAVVGWLATWPAEAVRGVIVSDQALNPNVREGRVYPPDALKNFKTWAAWDAFGQESMERLKRFIPFEWVPRYPRYWPEDSPQFKRHELVAKRLAYIFMRDESQTRMLESFLRTKPDLGMVHLWGGDFVSHAFWRAAFGDASATERLDFGNVITSYYQYLDELVGRLARAAGPDTLLVLLSDHGFTSWTPPPGDTHPFLTGNHTPQAVLILSGPGVIPNARMESPRIVDVTPTLERWLGIAPVSGREGRVLEEVFQPGFLPPSLPPRASTRRPAPSAPSALSPAEIERLRASGYLR